MNYTASAFRDDSSFADLPLQTLLEPIVEELDLTQALYQKTVLQTAESNYIHQILTGDGVKFWPDEFRVAVADQIALHLLKGEGKWLRSSLVLLAADACGLRDLRVRQAAVAIELIHMATLVHDDIIDEAPMRRGVQTVSNGWGNKIAVLLGDFLLSKAFRLLLNCNSPTIQLLMTRATGQMCLGEIKQLCTRQIETTEEEYLETINNKTASLMASATASGAHLAGLSDDLIEKIHGYGHALGMAFQITDDILDYTSSTLVLGKQNGIDLRNGKATLPLIHLLRQQGETVWPILNGNGKGEEKTKKLLSLMQETGSVDYANALARRFGDLARKNLQEWEATVGPSASLQSLQNLVDFVLNREK